MYIPVHADGGNNRNMTSMNDNFAWKQAKWAQKVPTTRTPGPRLLSRPSYACVKSSGCSIFNVHLEYGVAGVVAIAFKGTSTLEMIGLRT